MTILWAQRHLGCAASTADEALISAKGPTEGSGIDISANQNA